MSINTKPRPAMPPVIPGELLPEPGTVLLNADRPTHQVRVANPGDRPIQVGSHFHFHEVNNVLKFDRESCRGMRLDLPAGTAMRFEPGDERLVRLIPMAGKRRVMGFNGRINGRLDACD